MPFAGAAIPQSTLDRIAQNLADIGALALEDYLGRQSPAPPPPPGPAPVTELPPGANAITRLHQACQRALRNTNALKFEFVELPGSRNKQCILTITKPGGVHRSYMTQPVFSKKSEAKLEAAKIAVDTGALDFLAGGCEARASVDTSSADASVQSQTASTTCIDDIENCCLESCAGRVTPLWLPFFDPKSAHKQGCALRIQISRHVVRVYLSAHTLDTHMDAKRACAEAAVSEGVLDFIRHARSSSPTPPTPSTSPFPSLTNPPPWTLQAFFDSLPRPFPETFHTNDVSEINAPGWLNTMLQNARGGKLTLSFYFTSDGPPGLHGCLLKLDRPGEYKASLVDARFPKRSDAKAAVCLQALSEGIGNYIRSIASALDSRITPAMRSFSSSSVYPALTSELSKIDTNLVPLFEYNKERDAFSATLIVRLSTMPGPGQVRRYTVPSNYRNKADAKVAVICHAAEQGVVEFVRFQGGDPPDRYVSPYALHTYSPDASRKHKLPAEDAEEQGRPTKKRRTRRGTRGRTRHNGNPEEQQSSSNQIHGISAPGDMGPSQSVSTDGSGDPSQPGVGIEGGSGAAHPVMASYGGQTYVSYPAVLDPRFSGGRGYSVYPAPVEHAGAPSAVDALPLESGPSRAMPGSSARAGRWRVKSAELEPGEVVSSAESDFSESSSRNEEGPVCANESSTHDASEALDRSLDVLSDTNSNVNEGNKISESVDETVVGMKKNKGKERETSPTNTSTVVFCGGSGTVPTHAAAVSHVKKLIDHCRVHGYGTPSFHDTQRQGRHQVWIVIGRERFDLPTTYGSAEEGRQRVAKQVLARMSKGSSG